MTTPILAEGESVQEILILGWRKPNGKDGLFMAFKSLDSIVEGDLSAWNYFSTKAGQKALRGAKPGAIWTRVVDADNKWYTGGTHAPKFARMHADAALVQRLQIESRAADLEHQTWLRGKKAQEADQVLEALQPFRDVYRASSPQTRRVLLVLAIEYITKGL